MLQEIQCAGKNIRSVFTCAAILWLLFTAVCYARSGSYTNMLRYYPLAKGDYWEYKTQSAQNLVFRDSSAYSIEVVGDTTFNGGLSYEVMRGINFYPGADTFYSFVRTDSSTGLLYKRYGADTGAVDVKQDSLYAQPGDTTTAGWGSGPFSQYTMTICDSISPGTVLDTSTIIRYMYSRPGGVGVTVKYEMAFGVGLIREQQTGEFSNSSTALVYARVSGVEYGTKIKTIPDSLAGDLNFFPLSDGNYWQYESTAYGCGLPGQPCVPDSSIFSLEVAGDTLLPNGFTYAAVFYRQYKPARDSSYIFLRVDSATGSVFAYAGFPYDSTLVNHEQKIDSLVAVPGDTIVASMIGFPDYMNGRSYPTSLCQSSQNDNVFGVVTQVKTFRSLAPLLTESYGLVKGIGLTFEAEAWDGGYRNTYLAYARIGGHEYGRLIDAVSQPRQVPTGFALYQNYPNPFNPTTTIRFDLKEPSVVTLQVYNVLGQEVIGENYGKMSAGHYGENLDMSSFASGVYLYRIIARGSDGASFVKVKKLMLLK